MRRAAGMLGAVEEAARNASALRSLRVIATPAMALSPDPTTESEATPIRNPPSHTLRPLVLDTAIYSPHVKEREMHAANRCFPYYAVLR